MDNKRFDEIVERECNNILNGTEVNENISNFLSQELELNKRLQQGIINFKTIIEDRVVKIKSVLQSKGEEYGSVDRLHNFKLSQEILKEWGYQEHSILTIARMFQLKHIASICDMFTGDLEITKEKINEKIGDAINYEILIIAIKEEVEGV